MWVQQELENGKRRYRYRRWLAGTSLALVVALMASVPFAAGGATHSCLGEPRPQVRSKLKFSLGDRIHLEVDAAVPSHLVEEAVGYWRRCPGYGSGFPAFVTDAPDARSLRVHYVAGASGSLVCGRFKGRNVTVYEMALQERRLVPCGDPARVLAHELGHALGLADAPDIRKCRRHLMSRVYHAAAAPALQDEECAQVDRRWVTPDERDEYARMTRLEARDGVRTARSDGSPIPSSEQLNNSEAD